MGEIDRLKARLRRHRRVRKRVVGTKERPRLNVFRSLTHIYAQVIDDNTGEPITQARNLLRFHGLEHDEEDFSGYLVDDADEEIHEAGISGGKLRFVFRKDQGELWVETTYALEKQG